MTSFSIKIYLRKLAVGFVYLGNHSLTKFGLGDISFNLILSPLLIGIEDSLHSVPAVTRVSFEFLLFIISTS